MTWGRIHKQHQEGRSARWDRRRCTHPQPSLSFRIQERCALPVERGGLIRSGQVYYVHGMLHFYRAGPHAPLVKSKFPLVVEISAFRRYRCEKSRPSAASLSQNRFLNFLSARQAQGGTTRRKEKGEGFARFFSGKGFRFTLQGDCREQHPRAPRVRHACARDAFRKSRGYPLA